MKHLPLLPRKYKIIPLLGTALLILLILGAIYGERGLVDLRGLQTEQQRLEQEVFRLQHDNERLRGHIKHLRHDDHYLERWARERLQLARPGEIIYTFEGSPTPDRSKPPGASDQKP